MLEKEVRTTRVNSIDPPTGFEVMLTVAGDVAKVRNLSQEETEALSKFATITYRINEVTKDFDDLGKFKFANPIIGYAVGFNEKNELMRQRISKKEVPDFIRIHKAMAFNIYNDYLNASESTRLAAKEVRNYAKISLLETK